MFVNYPPEFNLDNYPYVNPDNSLFYVIILDEYSLNEDYKQWNLPEVFDPEYDSVIVEIMNID